jgi:hypothetical protein
MSFHHGIIMYFYYSEGKSKYDENTLRKIECIMMRRNEEQNVFDRVSRTFG